MKTTNEINTVPSHTSRAGKIRAAVWERHDVNGVTHKIMVNRLFRQGDKWQRDRTFFASELPAVVQAVSLGNSPAISRKHYIAPATRKEAEQFLQLTPEKIQAVLQLQNGSNPPASDTK